MNTTTLADGDKQPMKNCLTALICSLTLLAACSKKEDTSRADSIAVAAARQAVIDSIEAVQLVTIDTAIAPSLGLDVSRMQKHASGILFMDRKRGAGAVADSGKYMDVHYTTWLTDGTVLDDTRKEGKTRRILLGYGQVVKAWEEGLRGMHAGGRRVIISPASLGYGKPGKPGSVPRLATLVFDVEIVRVY